MSVSDRARWDAKYAGKTVPQELAPDEWLTRHVAGLRPGRALEVACGLGHNAVWLAMQGWQVDAVDVSPVGLSLAAELAARHGQSIHWIAADFDEFTAENGAYDLVVVFRFLDRRRLPGMIQAALRPGGLLIYETFHIAHLARPDSHIKNRAFALQPGELPLLFPEFAPVAFEERELPDRSVARLAAIRS